MPYIDVFRNMVHFEQFKKDTELHGIIKDIEDMSDYLINVHTNVKTKVLELSSMLEEELNKSL